VEESVITAIAFILGCIAGIVLSVAFLCIALREATK
jgi:uncharacterized membrane protein YgaE (UPF0421/DUF939 family)